MLIVKVGHLVVEIGLLQFFEFPKWLTVVGGPRRITLPNFVKTDRSISSRDALFIFAAINIRISRGDDCDVTVS